MPHIAAVTVPETPIQLPGYCLVIVDDNGNFRSLVRKFTFKDEADRAVRDLQRGVALDEVKARNYSQEAA